MTNDRMVAPMFHRGVRGVSQVSLEWGVAEGLLDASCLGWGDGEEHALQDESVDH